MASFASKKEALHYVEGYKGLFFASRFDQILRLLKDWSEERVESPLLDLILMQENWHFFLYNTIYFSCEMPHKKGIELLRRMEKTLKDKKIPK